MDKHYDLAVIGAGPAGYTAAIKAAELGFSICLIERNEIGGTCLNTGCIPTKTLIHTGNIFREIKDFEKNGICGLNTESSFVDMEKLQKHKEEVVQRLKNGILYLLKRNNVELITGEALILTENIISVKLIGDQDTKINGEEIQISAAKIIIATGSKPVKLQIPGIDLPNVVYSDELLSKRDRIYEELVVIGGGVIGVEFAMLYNSFGSKVTIIEALENLLPEMDIEISQNITSIMKKRGIKILTKTTLEKIESDTVLDNKGKLICSMILIDKGKEEFIACNGVLIAVGRKPNSDNLFSQNIKADMDGKRILVEKNFETSIKGVYAIGDVASKIQLAHLASAQGTSLAFALSGRKVEMDLNNVPSCIYTSPEIGSVGMTLKQALDLGIQARELKVQMQGNGKSLIEGQERGFIKLVVEDQGEKIIGAHILCNRATDMISEFSLAISMGLTRGDLAKVIRPHPTYSEAVSDLLFSIIPPPITTSPL